MKPGAEKKWDFLLLALRRDCWILKNMQSHDIRHEVTEASCLAEQLQLRLGRNMFAVVRCDWWRQRLQSRFKLWWMTIWRINNSPYLCAAPSVVLDYECGFFDASVFAWRKKIPLLLHSSPRFICHSSALIPSSGLFQRHASLTARSRRKNRLRASASTITAFAPIARAGRQLKFIWRLWRVIVARWDSYCPHRLLHCPSGKWWRMEKLQINPATVITFLYSQILHFFIRGTKNMFINVFKAVQLKKSCANGLNKCFWCWTQLVVGMLCDSWSETALFPCTLIVFLSFFGPFWKLNFRSRRSDLLSCRPVGWTCPFNYLIRALSITLLVG